MAFDDIQIHNSQGGVTPRILFFGMDAAEAFSKGDVVTLANTGQVQEALTTGVESPGLTGVAMQGPVGRTGTTYKNPKTDAAYATNDAIAVAMFDLGTVWKTHNYTEAATTWNEAAPSRASIGDTGSLMSIGGVWGFDSGEDADEATCRIIDVLNSKGQSIQDTGETLTATATDYWVILQVIAHMQTPDSGEATDPIAET
jgi:hypothetical protein